MCDTIYRPRRLHTLTSRGSAIALMVALTGTSQAQAASPNSPTKVPEVRSLNNIGDVTFSNDEDINAENDAALMLGTTGGQITARNAGTITGAVGFQSYTGEGDAATHAVGVSFNNVGSISSKSDDVVDLSVGDRTGAPAIVTVTNSGTITASAANSTALCIEFPFEGSDTVPKDSRVITIKNNGMISSNLGAENIRKDDSGYKLSSAISVFSGKDYTADIDNGPAGVIEATGARSTAIVSSAALSLVNAGTIRGGAGARIALSEEERPSKSFDYIDIPGAILGRDGDDKIVNTGSIIGAIDLADGNNRIDNAGLIDGDVRFGNGDDTFAATGPGRVTGLIDGGAGANHFLVNGGTANAPAAFTAIQNFQSLAVNQGVATIARSATVGRIDLTGGRLVGLSGSTITASEIIVGKDATFGSAGVVNANVTVAGTLSPGASPGTMVVNGDVALGKGSVSLFELGPVSDKLLINGKLSIVPGATLKLVAVGPVRPGRTLELIDASKGTTGNFTTIDKAANVPGALVLGPRGVELLTLFQAPKGTSRAVAGTVGYLNDLLTGGASDDLLGAIPKLLTSSGEPNAAALARLTPEPYAQAAQIGTDDALLLTQATRGAALAPYGDDAGLFTFGQALGQWHTLRGYAPTGSADAVGQTYGTIGGLGFADHGWVVGAFGGNLTNRQHVIGRGAQTRAESLITGIHSRYASTKGFGFSTALVFDGGRARTHRWLPDDRQVWSHYKLNSVTSDLSAFYAADVRHDWTLTPRVGLTYVRTTRGAMIEDGYSIFALDVARERHVAGFVDGGLGFSRSERSSEAWRPYVTLGARYQLQGQRVRAVGALDGGDLDLIGVGASRARLVGTVTAGVGYRPSDTIEIFAGASAQTGRDDHQETITAGVRARF
ncbi:autotransporter domain-containing protein [Sphingomonas sp. RHCKR7]|uniref:autotransporter outer membrane beta-barrel domain-containing protein n=1 Tax=Sphingomonas folli TaxID=2862497 RepID=UPI001CA47EEA|nr:autotransporter outer membrane beta-barrel domain-containing protein [Sphingomonas folli]MBW6526645.1 autotransporter domain-containing protein [Sphingomonas folli]